MAPPAEVQAERDEEDDGAQQAHQQRHRAAVHREVAVAHVPVPPPRHHLRGPAAGARGGLLRCHCRRYVLAVAGAATATASARTTRRITPPLPLAICGRGGAWDDADDVDVREKQKDRSVVASNSRSCVCGQARRPAAGRAPGGVWFGEVGDRARRERSRGWQVRWGVVIKFESARAVPFKVGERGGGRRPPPAVVG